MKILFAILIVFISNSSYPQLIPLSYEQDENLNLILEKIPDGWSVEWQSDTLIFKRQGDVYSLYENKINAPVSYETDEEFGERVKAHGSKIEAKVIVKLYHRWTPEKFAEANTHNNRIISKVLELQNDYDILRLRKESPHSKAGYFFVPETGDDEDRVRLFQIKKRELERELINIPDYHSEKFSYFISEIQGAEDEYVSISPQAASYEVYEILSLFQQHLLTYR